MNLTKQKMQGKNAEFFPYHKITLITRSNYDVKIMPTKRREHSRDFKL